MSSPKITWRYPRQLPSMPSAIAVMPFKNATFHGNDLPCLFSTLPLCPLADARRADPSHDPQKVIKLAATDACTAKAKFAQRFGNKIAKVPFEIFKHCLGALWNCLGALIFFLKVKAKLPCPFQAVISGLNEYYLQWHRVEPDELRLLAKDDVCTTY